jgi:hypothetical protein
VAASIVGASNGGAAATPPSDPDASFARSSAIDFST